MYIDNSDLTLPDRSLLQKLQSKLPGEKDHAWEYVYKTYYPMVKELIRKNSGTDDDATDIFQDGMLVLHRNISNGSFRRQSSIRTYLYSVCRNLWLKELDRRKNRIIPSSEMTADPAMALNSDDGVGYLIEVKIVGLLMHELSEECRNILIEYYYNSKSMAELKEIFNVGSIQAAKNKKWRCMGYLVKLCKERGIKPTTR